MFSFPCALLPLQVKEAEVGAHLGSEQSALLEAVPLSVQLLAEEQQLPVPEPEHWPLAQPSVQ